MRGVIAPGVEVTEEVRAVLAACPSMDGLDLATGVSTRKPYTFGSPKARNHIVAYDYGIKANILRLFDQRNCRVTVVPATTSAEAALELEPDGIFLSNGPGDPAAVAYAPGIIRTIADRGVPIFGICLGHQLLALTFGGQTEKMPYGHRGGNHPVLEIEKGRSVELRPLSRTEFSLDQQRAHAPGLPRR